MSIEDLIAEEDVVVTITRGGYAKRTKTDLYRSQQRGGKGVRGAQLTQDDIVDHFFVTTTHHWILFFTNKGRVYRAKAYELPEAGRDARGQHVANLLAFQPDETIAQVLDLRDYERRAVPRAGHPQRPGQEDRARPTYDSPRTGGVIAINLREDDELIAAELVSPRTTCCWSRRKAQSIRFTADDDALRPMGRATSGVIGMRFREDDELLVDGRRARGHVRVHRDRRRLRQAHRRRGVPRPGPRRPRRQGDEDRRGPRLARRRRRRRRGRRGPRDHARRRGDPYRGLDDRADRPRHHGRPADEPQGRRHRRRVARNAEAEADESEADEADAADADGDTTDGENPRTATGVEHTEAQATGDDAAAPAEDGSPREAHERQQAGPHARGDDQRRARQRTRSPRGGRARSRTSTPGP